MIKNLENWPYNSLHIGYLYTYLPNKLEYLHQNNLLETYLSELLEITKEGEQRLVKQQNVDEHTARFIALHQYLTPDRLLLGKTHQKYAFQPQKEKLEPYPLKDIMNAQPKFEFGTTSMRFKISSKDIVTKEKVVIKQGEVNSWYKRNEKLNFGLPIASPYQMQVFDSLAEGKVLKVNILYHHFSVEDVAFSSLQPSDLFFLTDIPMKVSDISFNSFSFHYLESFKVKVHHSISKYEKHYIFDKESEQGINHYQLTFPEKKDDIIKIYSPPEPNWDKLTSAETFLFSDIDLF